MWNFLDDLKNWYLDKVDGLYQDKHALYYVNEKLGIKIPYGFVEEIVNGIFGTQDILDDTRNELNNMRIFNELLIEKLQRLEGKVE